MEWWQAIILGVVQGLTEFLPVSSSGHLFLFEELLGLEGGDEELLAFYVALHAGTLVALVAYFWRDISTIARAWATSVVQRRVETVEQRLSWLIALGSLPAVAFYLLMGEQIEAAQDNLTLIASMLIGIGIVFIVVERFRGERQIEDVRWHHALAIGCGQALALIPGTSRSGATIATGLAMGFDRVAAARFSFLLSTPIVLGAFLVKLPDLAQASSQDSSYLIALVVGFVAAVVSGYVAVAGLLRFLGGHSLAWFAVYRIPVGVAFLIYLQVR